MEWDPFDAIERDVRAMITDPRWAEVPTETQVQSMAARLLRTPDGGGWLFGSHSRWYRHDGSDGRWHLSAPPAAPAARASARPLHPAPMIPPEILPTAADFAFDRGSTQAFVGPDVPHHITERIRELVHGRQVPHTEFPSVVGPLGALFYSDVPATVAAVWGTVMWCSYAPAFDGNEVLLSMFGEFIARPLPGDDWVRWLPPLPLDALIALYAERLGHGAQGAALRLAVLVADTARVLRDDPRFAPRANALLAMIEPLRTQPWLDHPAWDAVAIRQAWLARCPPHLRGAILAETAPEDHFRHSLYDLVHALSFVSAEGADPRAVAASLLAADVQTVAPGAAAQLYPWLDAELRQTYYVTLADPGHPLRGCWPSGGRPPDALRPPDRDAAAALLGAGYATGLAWCRLTGTAPPEHGFPTSAATAGCLLHERDDPRPGVPGTSAEWIRHT